MRPELSVYYCDDIRHEVGGKVSIMGIYGSHILYPSLPTRVAKLCVHFSVDMPEGIGSTPIKFKLLKGSDQVFDSEIKYNEPVCEEPEPIRKAMRVLNGGFELVNIEVDQDDIFQLIMDVNGTILKGAGLRVTTQQDITDNPPIENNKS